MYCTVVASMNVTISSGLPATASGSVCASIGAGSSLGGVVAGVVAALLVVGILYGCWKLKYSSGRDFQVKHAGDAKCEADK